MLRIEMTAAQFKWVVKAVSQIDDSGRMNDNINIAIEMDDNTIVVFDDGKQIASSNILENVDVTMLKCPMLQNDIHGGVLSMFTEYSCTIEHNADRDGRTGVKEYDVTISDDAGNEVGIYSYPNEEEAKQDVSNLIVGGLELQVN